MGNLNSSLINRRKSSNVSSKHHPPSSSPPLSAPIPSSSSSAQPPLQSCIQFTSSQTDPLLKSAGFVRRATLRLQKKLSVSTTPDGLTQQCGITNHRLRESEPTTNKKNKHHQSVITDDTNVYRLGRRFQNINSKYVLPNDEIEQDRLTNLHFILKHCFSGNYSAPVQGLLQQPASTSPSWHNNNISTTALSHGSNTNSSISSTNCSSSALSSINMGNNSSSIHHSTLGGKIEPRVLDIACGTGIWILEMASEFPHAQFYGIDLSTMYPADIKPPNTNFCQGDVLNGLPFMDAFFDFVHMSLTYNCFSSQDRKHLLHEIRRVLKPGGYVEFREVDPTIRNAGPLTVDFNLPFAQIMHKRLDVDVNWASHMCESAQKFGGMTDIHHQVVSISFVSSSKLSTSFNTSVLSEWESYRSFCLGAYHLVGEEYDNVIQSVMDECKKKRSYLNYVMCWGRKPIIDVSTSSPSLHRAEYGTTPQSGHVHHQHRNSNSNTTTSSYQNHDASSFMKSMSPGPDHSNSTFSRPSPTSGTQSSGKNSPGSLRAREDARRNKEKASDIYQFVHGFIE